MARLVALRALRVGLILGAAPPLLLADCGGSAKSGGATPGTDSGVAEAGPANEASAPDGSGVDAPIDHAIADGGVVPEATVVPGTNFAFRHYFLGDTDRTGASSTSAWRLFGTNVDGKDTTAASTDVCTLAPGAAASTQTDGPGGIDNSWGANLMPLWVTLFGSSLSTNYNAAVDGGAFTTMIDVVGLTDAATQTGAAPGWGFAGASFGGPPTWTTADDWPVYPNWLEAGTLASGSTIAFPGGGTDAGTWTSGAPTDLPFQFGYGAVGISLVIHQATVSFVHATPTTASGGNVGGLLDTQEFVTALSNAAGWISTALCSGSALDSIVQQVEQAQDIVHDGSNGAGVPCDAISIGLGFEAVQIGPVQQVTFPLEPLPNICPEAGGD